jgi:hypothetical protein
MAVYQALLLNTVVPQIQAAQAGDSYVMVVNATTPALRITQTGTGDSILVEDAANPDSTPFVVTAAGDVGIGTSSPAYKLDVSGSVIRLNNSGSTADIFLTDSGTTNGHVRLRGESNAMKFITGNGISATLDTSGNLGLGVAPTGYLANKLVISTGTDSNNGITIASASNRNGSIWFADGTTGDQAYRGGIDYQHTSDALVFYAGGQGNMRLDASGNLGIGTSSPTQKLTLVNNAASTFLNITDNTVNTLYGTSTGLSAGLLGTLTNHPLVFYANNGERARITSGGILLVGTQNTNPAYNAVDGIALSPTFLSVSNTGGVAGAFNRNSDGVVLYWTRSGAAVGDISVTTTSTAYNTSSDYRLKDNPQPLTNSGAFIDALKPKTWDWKADGSKGVGFIAHEVQEVSPGTVVGDKDAVDADGKPVMQAMEYGSAEFIANIVAELQSLRARVAQLEAK